MLVADWDKTTVWKYYWQLEILLTLPSELLFFSAAISLFSVLIWSDSTSSHAEGKHQIIYFK